TRDQCDRRRGRPPTPKCCLEVFDVPNDWQTPDDAGLDAHREPAGKRSASWPMSVRTSGQHTPSTLGRVMERATEHDAAPPMSFYDAVGGEETFTRLVRRFYAEVESDPELRAVYPSKDLGPAEEHLRLFLMQYWGGPTTYNERRGHPRLRMRHV